MEQFFYKFFKKELLDALIGIILNFLAVVLASKEGNNIILFLLLAIIWLVYFCFSKKLFILLKKAFGFNICETKLSVAELSFNDIVNKCEMLDEILKNHHSVQSFSNFECERLFDEWRTVVVTLNDSLNIDIANNNELFMDDKKESNAWNRKKYIPIHYIRSMIEVVSAFRDEILPELINRIQLDEKVLQALICQHDGYIANLNKII